MLAAVAVAAFVAGGTVGAITIAFVIGCRHQR